MNTKIVIVEMIRLNTKRPQRRVPLTDCIAYKNGQCEALNELYCKKHECNFYKWRERA